MIATSRVTGPNAPGTAADGGGPKPWTNVNNAKVLDGSTADSDLIGPGGGGGFPNDLILSNFGFNLPNVAIIDGIKVTAKVNKVGGGASDFNIALKPNGGSFNATSSTPNFGLFWPSSPDFLTWGGPATLWGHAYTPAEINGSGFSFAISAFFGTGVGDIHVDYVEVTVYWHFDPSVPAAEVPQRYDYKIYDPTGKFLGNVPNVVKPFGTSQAINTTGAQLAIEAAGTPDGQLPTVAPGALTRWLNPAWKYRQKLTVSRGKVSGDLSNFPVYVDLSNLGSQFWAGVHSTGKDIRITDQYGVQELPFEIISINTGTKTGFVWFKAGLIESGYDTDFYVYYGNTAASLYASTDAFGSKNVWAGFSAVYHLNDGTTLNNNDASPAANNLTNVGIVAHAGRINGGANAQDSADLYTLSTVSLAGGIYSISTWFNPSTMPTGGFNTLSRSTAGADHHVLIDRGGLASGDTGLIGVWNGTWHSSGFSILSLSAGWHHMVATTNGSNTDFYIDGVLVGTANAHGTNDFTYLMNYQAGGQPFGAADEIRLATVARNAAWAAAEYASMNSPSTFYTVGRQQLQAVEDGSSVLLRNGNLVNVWETSYYYPNGKLKFQGQINRIEAEFAPEVNGIVRAICHSDGRDMDNMVARGIPFTYTNDVVQNSQNTRVSNITYGGKFAGWDRWGQTWIAGVSSLGRIQLMLDGIAHVTVNVWSSAGLGTLLGTVTQFVSVGGPTVIDFMFPDLIPTTIGQGYFFEVLVDAGESIWVQCSSSNPYANGGMYESNYSGGSGGGSYGAVSGYDLYFVTASGTPGTTATYSSSDPTTGMLVSVMNDYLARSGNIGYNGSDIEATGLSLTATFKTNTVYEVIDKVLDMAPSGFYYYVDLGTNKLVFKRAKITPDYLLVKGRHIESLQLAFSIENVINEELFSGGETAGVNLYAKYTDATSKALFGARIERKSDNRVTVQATADAIGKSRIREFKNEQYYTTISVLARTMNITDIKPGQTIGLRGFGSFIDNMVLQITKNDYSPERAQLQVGTLPVFYNDSFEEIVRGLVAEQTVNNPSTPS